MPSREEPGGNSGEVFALDIPFYRTKRAARGRETENMPRGKPARANSPMSFLSPKPRISRGIGQFLGVCDAGPLTGSTWSSKFERLAPREQHFEEMKTGMRARDAAKLLIVGTVRQISDRVFGLGVPRSRSLF